MDEPERNKDINSSTVEVERELEPQYPDSIDTGTASRLASADASADTGHVSPYVPASTMQNSETVVASSPSSPPSSRRFLAAYIASILSGLSLLTSGAFLGYSLLDHFLAPEDTSQWSGYFDLAPLYLALITSMLVFGTLYLITSQYVARQVARDTVGVRDWRAYRVVYAAFTAVLLTVAASIIASLVYIPLAFLLVVQDYAAHEVWIQVLGGIHVLVWVAVLIWQERLVKQGREVALQGIFTAVLAILVVALASIFLVGSKTDERYDNRASSDLTVIASAIDTYKSNNAGKLPANLGVLDFKSSPLVEKRIEEYKYNVKQSQSVNSMRESDLSRQRSLQDGDSDSVRILEGVSSSYDPFSSSSSRSQTRQSYELCASFRTKTTEDQGSPLGALLTMGGAEKSFHVHNKGEVCFTRN